MERLAALMLALWMAGAMLCAPAAAADGNTVRRALLIGCDAFLTHENTAPSARLNVERMARALASDARGYAAVRQETDGLSSLQDLQSAIGNAFAGADGDDVSLVYLCTHGLYDRISYAPLLVLSDGTREESLTAPALKEALDAVPGRKILILDACNSGAFIGKGARGEGTQNLFAGDDYLVLTSAGALENSFLWHDRQLAGGSYFAQELCDGLLGGGFDLDADGVVTLAEARQGLLECHGASTAQSYPQFSDAPLYVRPQTPPENDAPLTDVVLDTASLSPGEDTLYFSFTVRRTVRVQYQIIYYRGGQWRFDAPQTVEDQENSRGGLTPGRKQRAVTLTAEESAPTGYALLQIVAQEDSGAVLAGSRLIAVQPESGDPGLELWCSESARPTRGEEVCAYVRHAFPCRLTVRVLDESGAAVRRLAYKTSSRPVGERQDGSYFYWDGRLEDGTAAPPGLYALEVTCAVGGQTYRLTGSPVRIE